MFAAMMLFLTAAFGWTAAATKNDCLSYCVSAAFSQLTRLIIVWIPCHVHHACIHLAWSLHFHRQVEPCLADEWGLCSLQWYGLWAWSDLRAWIECPLLWCMPVQCWQGHLLRWGGIFHESRHYGPDKAWPMPLRLNRPKRRSENQILPHPRDPGNWLPVLRLLQRIKILPLFRCEERHPNFWHLQSQNHKCCR